MFDILLGVLAGLGIFIYAMHLLTDSLKQLSLEKIKNILDKSTNNRLKAFFVGTGITALIQSSSATSVIIIGFLNVGLIKLSSAIPIIFGANIGTTITAQLIAFKLTKVAPLFIFSGAITFFLTKKNKHRSIGLAILGFGLLFFGLSLMSGSVKGLSTNDFLLTMFQDFGRYPILGIMVGIVITAMFQSSSTTIGMVIALALAGLMDFRTAFYIILGDNIGTCVTAVLASFGGNVSAKRLALAHTLFNVFGTVIAIILAPLYLRYIPMMGGDVARQIANSHTVFNIFNALIFLPLVPSYVIILKKMVKGRDYFRKNGRYLDRNLISTPALAIKAVKMEMTVMLSICHDMLKKVSQLTEKFDHKLEQEINVDEESVDMFERNISQYVVEISRNRLFEKNSNIIPVIMHNINDIERIGDHMEKLTKIFQKRYEHDLEFSPGAVKDFKKLFALVDSFIKLTTQAIIDDDTEIARKALKIEDEINRLVDSAARNHIGRIHEGQCTCRSGLLFSDAIRRIERVGDHLKNLCEGVIELKN